MMRNGMVGSLRFKFFKLIISGLFAAALLPSWANAVSLIAGVPNAEITRKGVFMIAHESQVPIGIGGLTNSRTGGNKNWTGFNFFTYGLNSEWELASTFYNFESPASQRITGSLGYKWARGFSQFDTAFTHESRLIFGQELLIALQGTEGVGVWTFAGASLRLRDWKTRFTVGPSFATRQMLGNTQWKMFAGVEQPLNEEWGLLADWFSGDHLLGATITAVQWRPNSTFTLITGPKWANSAVAGVNTWMVEFTVDLH